ncbi:AbrB/MazE/SpoVT family DNA-binding domain-containing protein [Bradyrhizobium sp. USDA 329]|uniref:AbrB/MazE/SpoVT family DNA-binding domain-containing protein n=1 Tax=unclassified Bradyrhizobium TaxID=2631580 RepID=UPI0035164F02
MEAVLKVFKWGDDLAIELPHELVSQLALKEGDELEIVAAVGAESVEARISSGERDGLQQDTR